MVYSDNEIGKPRSILVTYRNYGKEVIEDNAICTTTRKGLHLYNESVSQSASETLIQFLHRHPL